MAIQYNSNFEGTIPFSDVSVPISLTANTEQTYAVPGVATTKYQAYFSYNANSNVFVRLNNTAAVPALNSAVTVPYQEFRPEKRYVQGGDVLHFITSDTQQFVGLSLRQLPG